MILYHYSVDSWKGGDRLINDYKEQYRLAEPFLLALRESRETFRTVYLAAMYYSRELIALKLRKYENCQKDAIEAIFEYVRETEYLSQPSRLQCVYYCRSKEEAMNCAEDDCFADHLFTKDQVKLLEVEVDDARVAEYDQTFYNRSFAAISQYDFETVFDLARDYYDGKRSDEAITEILSDGENRILREIAF